MFCVNPRFLLLAGLVAICHPASVTFGQGNTFNPYGNSGYADYREFAKPLDFNDSSLPGQARLQSGVLGRNRANQFDTYANSLDNLGEPNGIDRGAPSGIPYYQAQRFSNRNRQGYRANDTLADRQYREQVQKRNDAYSKALEEKDPRKQALKLQQIERQDVISRLPASNTPRAARAAATPGTPPRRPTPSANLKPLSSADRTTTQPGGTPSPAPVATPVNPSTVAIPAPAPN